jgi:cytochrome c-type biogenesis protein CcmH/NrfG
MSGNFAASLVQFTQFSFSGLEMNAGFVLESKPARQEQKLIALRKYVQKYPQGWKKRLELANLLYQMGNWQQAVAEYYQTIEQQPHLIDVQLQLGKILQMRLISGKEGKLTKKMIASALQQAPYGAAARNSLAYYHILRGDLGGSPRYKQC